MLGLGLSLSLGAQQGGGGAPAPVNTVRAVGTGGRVATGPGTLSSTTRYRNRTVSTIRTACTYVEFLFPCWHIASSGSSGVTTYINFASGTTAQTQADYYANGTVSGANLGSGTVNGEAIHTFSGNIDFLVCRFEASTWGLTEFPAGCAIACMIEVEFPANGGSMEITDSAGTNSSSVSGEATYYGGTTSIGTGGSIQANGGSQQTTRNLRPFAVIGDGDPDVPIGSGTATIAIGDSNVAGKGCPRPAGNGSTKDSGMAAFGLWNSGFPFTVCGKDGDRASYWNAASDTDVRYTSLQWFDNALILMGTNDLSGVGDGGAAAIAAVQGMRAKIAAANPAMGIGQATIPPRTSNSAFTDTASQTIQSGYANGDTPAGNYNAQLSADVGVSNLDLVFDLRTALGDTIETDKWAVLDTGGAKVQTGGVSKSVESDGTHLSSSGTYNGVTLAAPVWEEAAETLAA